MELSIEEALRLVDEMGKLRVFEAVITGGEPMLRVDWSKIAEGLYENRIHVSMVTNGWFMNRKYARMIRELEFKWVQVSIDGARPETHDKIRGVKGSWTRARRAVQYLADENVDVYVAFVPTKLNFSEVDELINLAVKWGAKKLLTQPLILTGKAALNMGHLKPSYNDYMKFFKKLNYMAQRYGKRFKINGGHQLNYLEIFFTAKMASPNLYCVVTPEGYCRLHCILPFTYGNLRKQSLKEIWMTYLRNGWQRPEVVQFIKAYSWENPTLDINCIPYITPEIHIE